MNISSVIGVILGISVMYLALTGSSSDLRFFLDFHGILIVVGGTAAAASICFPLMEVIGLVRVFLLRVLGRNTIKYQEIISEILDLSKKSSLGIGALQEYVPKIKNLFLKEAVSLVATGILSEHEIRVTLEQRLKTIESHYNQEANRFRTIGRFPPAFGLLATTLGMISLLQKIGQPDSQKLIGPAMSVGLIGTLYGISLANLIFIPIAENLSERTLEEIMVRKMIIEGVLLLKAQVNPITMREILNSYLLPRHRTVKNQKPNE